MSPQATSSQTVGPYFSIGLNVLNCDELAGPAVAGQRIEIQGRVLDGDGVPVPDALIETWQANAQGKYAEDDLQGAGQGRFTGFGRMPTNKGGCFRLSTIKPGSVPGPDGTTQAPHILVSVFMRGLLNRLVTRIYFPGDPQNDKDLVLSLVDPARRSTLIAKPVPPGEGEFEWNVILQGEDETVFFDC